MIGRAVFPGSFDPLTVAHLAIADAVVDQLAVVHLDLVISQVALAKERVEQTSVAHRVASIRRHVETRPWLDAKVTDAQLLADIADGYDVLVIGADKWHQLVDVRFYEGSARARDEAVARLPRLAIAPRAGVELPRLDGVHLLEVDPDLHTVSSTAVRAGRAEWRA